MTLSKILVPCVLLSLLHISCGVNQKQDMQIKAMSFNIRYDNPNDGVHRWDLRKDWVAEIIQQSDADLVGLQEALRHQIDTLAALLPGYAWVGQGRDDGRDAGEFSPLLYQRDRMRILSTGTFWLSPYPDSIGSVGWDAALPRIVTWAAFKEISTGRPLFYFNTHFDHLGETARIESAKLIRRRIQEIAGASPFVLTGDFNATETSAPYMELVRQTGGPADLMDSRSASEGGDQTTYRGFEVGDDDTRTIDYVFFSRHFSVTGHNVLTESRNGSYPSDHLPVLATAFAPDLP